MTIAMNGRIARQEAEPPRAVGAAASAAGSILIVAGLAASLTAALVAMGSL